MVGAWLLTAPEGGLLYVSLFVFLGASVTGLRLIRKSSLERGLKPMLAVGTVALTFLLGAIALRQGHPPIFRRYEMLVGAAWVVSASHWVLVRRWRHPSLSAVTALLLALLTTFALLLVPKDDGEGSDVRSLALYLHVVLALVGCAAFTLAAGLGALYLWQIRAMKRNPLAAVSRRMPPLESLDRINFIAVAIGFPLLGLSLVAGWIRIAGSTRSLGDWLRDPTVLATLAGFFAYLVLFVSRGLFGWRGRRIAWLTLAGFLLVVVGYVVASFCTSPLVLHRS